MDLEINKELSKKLDEFCRTKIIPNILFHGSSGSGKKTIVLDFISKIYDNNKKNIKENVLFVNCSQCKGIKYIREELKTFAKYNIHISHELPFKSIIMLNFDYLSTDSQSIMRRIIEQFQNTRFFIIIENKYKLLKPIISRFCSIYIPEHIVNNNYINLHQYKLNNINTEISIENVEYIINIINNIDDYCLIDECVKLYEMGISCINLIDIIKNINTISEINKSKILMRFYILKKEYRCEKLLMFHIFTLLYPFGNI
jgi:DNA polymerase III delta prime subunit